MAMSMMLIMEQRLTLAQRMAIDNKVFHARMELIDAVYGERFDPKAECPGCAHRLEPAEILRGFNRDPDDFRTTCPKCKQRFEAKLYRSERYGRIEVPFYCPCQTLNWLHSCDRVPIEEFKKRYPAVYNSAKVHFGTLRAAFLQIQVEYGHDEQRDWKEKVVAYLGKLPDTVIASCVNVSTRLIRMLRKQHGIEAFRRSSLVE